MRNKPSPTQALLLRSLNNPPERDYLERRLYIYVRNFNGEVTGYNTENISGKKPGLSTVKILLKNNWIGKTKNGYEYYVISQEGKAVLSLLTEDDFIVKKNNNKSIWSTSDIENALREKYQALSDSGYTGAPRWIYYTELMNGRSVSRRVDFWAMNCWHSENYLRISYEIKISRSDFLHEIKDPSKRDFGMSISNQFYFVTPPGLIKDEELPESCGLVEMSEEGQLITVIKAPMRKPDFIFTWDFAAVLGRRLFKQESRINGGS